MIKIYTTGCPKCQILEMKLEQKGILFEEVTDISLMERMGIDLVPMLEVEENCLLPFNEAVKWVNNYIGESLE